MMEYWNNGETEDSKNSTEQGVGSIDRKPEIRGQHERLLVYRLARLRSQSQ